MSVPHLQTDPLHDERFAEARAFLADRQISPDDEEAILAALRERGWKPAIGYGDGEWMVTLAEDTPVAAPVAVGHDPDRTHALLDALRRALSWLSPQEERELFDHQTRDLLGIGAEEFKERLAAGALPEDDPRVVHLLLIKPLGW
jgi:hypothetical protein